MTRSLLARPSSVAAAVEAAAAKAAAAAIGEGLACAVGVEDGENATWVLNATTWGLP